jgi:pimeloyl-ACP methyl ester carboxylesterase
MGRVSKAAACAPIALEWDLPWGPTLRGIRWVGSEDRVWLLHEPGADLDAWGALPSLIADRLGLDVLAIDLPGHGLSDDPWAPDDVSDLMRFLAGRFTPARKQFVIAAGSVATTALELAAELDLAGLIAFSPTPSRVSPFPRSPLVPKLLLAGSLAGDDVRHARRLASASGGWAVVTSVPVAAQGTAMLATSWGQQVTEQIVSFLRDCQRLRTSPKS